MSCVKFSKVLKIKNNKAERHPGDVFMPKDQRRPESIKRGEGTMQRGEMVPIQFYLSMEKKYLYHRKTVWK